MAAGTTAGEQNGESQYLLEEARAGAGKIKQAWEGFKGMVPLFHIFSLTIV